MKIHKIPRKHCQNKVKAIERRVRSKINQPYDDMLLRFLISDRITEVTYTMLKLQKSTLFRGTRERGRRTYENKSLELILVGWFWLLISTTNSLLVTNKTFKHRTDYL